MKQGIEEVRRNVRLTRRAMYHYEEIGLIKADRDRHNARRYDHEAQWRLAWIALLRRADVGLHAIREGFEAALEPETMRERALQILKARHRELDCELAAVRAAIDEVTEGPRFAVAQRRGADLRRFDRALHNSDEASW